MPYKHQVTDSKGQVHKRVSAERQYAFAVITHCGPFTWEAGGKVFPARSHANWSRTRPLAEKAGASMRTYRSYESTEIIPCTPVATGKHKEAV